MRFYQACYGKNESGWGLFNVSDDISADMLYFFEKVGSNCSPKTNGNIIEKNFIFYKIAVGKNSVCVFQSKYDGDDTFGRPKMFTHGFLMDKNVYLDNPKIVLYIADENFHFSIQQTIRIPTELSYETDFVETKISDQLIKCICLLIHSQHSQPFYIIGNNVQDKMRGIMQAILSFLPRSLRRNLSFTNSEIINYADEKIIIFSDSCQSDSYYYNFDNGDTNFISKTNEIEADFTYFPFYTKWKSLNNNDYKLYCELLDSKLSLITNEETISVNDVISAHYFTISFDEIMQMHEDNLLKFVQEILTNSLSKCKYADDFIAKVFEICEKKTIIFPIGIIKKAERRFVVTTSRIYRDDFVKICKCMLLKSGKEYIINFLMLQFDEYLSNFLEWFDFVKKHCEYEFHEILFEKIIINIQSLSECEKVAKFMINTGVNINSTDFIWLFVDKYVKMNVDCLQNYEFDNYEVLLSNIQNIVNLFPVDVSNTIKENITKEYWATFNYSKLILNEGTVDALSKIRPMDTNVELLIQIFESVKKNEDFENIKSKINLFIKFNTIPQKNRTIIFENILQLICMNDTVDYIKKDFVFWYKLSLNINANFPIDIMIKYKLPILCDTDIFKVEAKTFLSNYNLVDMISQLDKVCKETNNVDIKNAINSDKKILEQIKFKSKFRGLFKLLN